MTKRDTQSMSLIHRTWHRSMCTTPAKRVNAAITRNPGERAGMWWSPKPDEDIRVAAEGTERYAFYALKYEGYLIAHFDKVVDWIDIANAFADWEVSRETHSKTA